MPYLSGEEGIRTLASLTTTSGLAMRHFIKVIMLIYVIRTHTTAFYDCN